MAKTHPITRHPTLCNSPKLILRCFAAFLSFFPYLAFAEQDGQLWTVINLTKKIDNKLSANMEGQWRFIDDASAFGQRLLRPSITYQLDETFSVTAGYVHVLTNPRRGSSFEENRPWQQLGYTIFNNEFGLAVSGRSRIEQRFVENGDDLGWRFRQFLRLDAPFRKQGETKMVLWNETFFGLNVRCSPFFGQ